MKVSPKAAPWNLENMALTPIKHIPVKTRPEVKALIAQELPDDEDDEEYEPSNDDIPVSIPPRRFHFQFIYSLSTNFSHQSYK